METALKPGEEYITTTVRLTPAEQQKTREVVAKRNLRSVHAGFKMALNEWLSRNGKAAGIYVEVDSELYDQLEMLANGRNMSVTDVVRTCCEQALQGQMSLPSNSREALLVRSAIKAGRAARRGHDTSAELVVNSILLYSKNVEMRESRAAKRRGSDDMPDEAAQQVASTEELAEAV